MFSPEMNRWQMALANSAQIRGALAGHLNNPYVTVDVPASFSGIGMCCLGVCLHANGADIKDLMHTGMPITYFRKRLGHDKMPVNSPMQMDLSILNDCGLSHRIIREMLIDFALSGDPTEIHELSKTYLSKV